MSTTSPPASPLERAHSGRLVAGLLLVLFGVGWLLEVLDVIDFPWDVLLPVALVLVGVAATAVSLAYYLNVVRWLYMRTAPAAPLVAVGGSPPRDYALGVAITAAVVVTVGSFVFAQPVLDLASDAAASLPF